MLNTTTIADDSRAMTVGGGNFSLTFVPLITLVATFMPRILSRVKTLRPTKTTSERGYRTMNLYANNNLDTNFCYNAHITEIKPFPGFNDIFYTCQSHEGKKNCEVLKNYYFTDEIMKLEQQSIKIGKIIGENDCFYLNLYKCNGKSHYDPDKKKCIVKKN